MVRVEFATEFASQPFQPVPFNFTFSFSNVKTWVNLEKLRQLGVNDTSEQQCVVDCSVESVRWGEVGIPADPDQYWGEGGEGSGFLEYQHHPVLYQSVPPQCHHHTGTMKHFSGSEHSIISADDESVTQYDDVPHFIISLSQGSCCLMLIRIIISIYEI